MKYESEQFNLGDSKEWEVVAPGMKRKIMGYNDDIMLVHVHFEKGAVGVNHTHIHSQTTFVVSGKFEVNIDGKKQVLKGGDGFYVAPNLDHGAVCLEEGVLIDVFSPAREDFLEGNSGYQETK